MVSLVGRVFFSCVSVFFSLALSKLAISPMSGLSAIFLKQSQEFRSEPEGLILLPELQQETKERRPPLALYTSRPAPAPRPPQRGRCWRARGWASAFLPRLPRGCPRGWAWLFPRAGSLCPVPPTARIPAWRLRDVPARVSGLGYLLGPHLHLDARPQRGVGEGRRSVCGWGGYGCEGACVHARSAAICALRRPPPPRRSAVPTSFAFISVELTPSPLYLSLERLSPWVVSH